MGQTNPEVAATLVILLMSLAGLPPIAGFVGKLGIFWFSLSAHQYELVFLALISTCLSTYYYLRIIRIIYYGHMPSAPNIVTGSGLSPRMTAGHGSTQTLAEGSQQKQSSVKPLGGTSLISEHTQWVHFYTKMPKTQAYFISIITVILCTLLWYSTPVLLYHELLCS
jgi:NADH:ubiquinone oxidoreductase subunit 5 (subunit L)/multisubunit Na+/H+ antiporter MnhA subunit